MKAVMTVYRIVESDAVERAFDGQSMKKSGGRWNAPGLAAVYCATSPSLAQLECLVHLETSKLRGEYSLIAADVDDTDILHAGDLPRGWDSHPPAASVAFGSDWLRSARSLGLRVPSVVSIGEWNIILNPAHPRAASIKVQPARHFRFDHRLAE